MKLSTYRTLANLTSTLGMILVLTVNREQPLTSAVNLPCLVVLATSIAGLALDVRERRSYRRELGRSARL